MLAFPFWWILTLGHIVRLAMLAECWISTQKWPEIQGKGQGLSKMYGSFPKLCSVSWKYIPVSQNCVLVSQKTEIHFRRDSRKGSPLYYGRVGGDPFLEFLVISGLKFHILPTWWVLQYALELISVVKNKFTKLNFTRPLRFANYCFLYSECEIEDKICNGCASGAVLSWYSVYFNACARRPVLYSVCSTLSVL